MPNKITRIEKSAVTDIENPISEFKSRVDKIKGKLMRERIWIKEARDIKRFFFNYEI